MNTTKVAPSRLWLGVVQVLVGLAVIAFLAGAYRAYTYSWPLWQGQPAKASGSMLGDRPAALLDAAVAQYKAGNFDESARLLKLATEELHDAQGNLKPERRELAAEIKYLSGLTAERLKQTEQAKDYYRDTLRLKPGHLYAIWNLERLEKPNLGSDGAAGGGGSNSDPSQQPDPNKPQDGNQPTPPGTKPSPPKRGI